MRRNGNFLTAFLHPLTKDAFIKKHWRKSVYVAHNGGTQRLRASFHLHYLDTSDPAASEEWVNEHLHALDLPTLLEETPSPNIHVWMTPPSVDGKRGPIESFETDDVNTALVCHNAGRASLYFRAPQPMADQVVRELSDGLGMLTR